MTVVLLRRFAHASRDRVARQCRRLQPKTHRLEKPSCLLNLSLFFGEMVVLVLSVWKACAIRRTIGASLARWIRPVEALVFRLARANAAQ